MRTWFLILLFFCSGARAQNLLMNGGFEDENICTEYSKNCAPEAWISTSLRADYYFYDAKNAFEGDHFIGVVIGSSYRTGTYSFLRSRLLCKLRKGAQYRLECHIRTLHDFLDSIGIYFSSNDILFQKSNVKNNLPQIWIGDSLKSSQLGKWQKISVVYTASGDENFITIGDFQKKEHHFSESPDLGPEFFFFVDEISLVPQNPNEKICPDAEKIRQEEYDVNERHNLLDRKIYLNRKNPPLIENSSTTILQRIDTLVIPDVLFATNSYQLNSEANQVLDSFVRNSAHLAIDSLIVEGHTDSTGPVILNQKLSENRALSVASYLQPQFKTAIITRGRASGRPVADNRNAAGRQKNRRVEIYLYVRE